ncbi:MAG: hypothetical protein JXB49_22485 [Bacteroidales bacterium]|nr:hypothetical protein [Bacteroidales bacterium]
MRLWSLHPKYLDTKGLVALWREALLAKNVLEGNTKGYKNHPQLERFKESDKAMDAINQYLSIVYNEAILRNYNFDKNKIDWNFTPVTLTVTTGQVHYEAQHLLRKLKVRDKVRYYNLLQINSFELHPIFSIIVGDIQDWEKVGVNHDKSKKEPAKNL